MSRPSAVAAGVLAVVLVVAGAFVWWDQRPYSADLDDLGPGGSSVAAPGLATRALSALRAAVTAGDSAAARALAPAGDRAAGDRLAAVVDNAEALRVEGFDLRYLDELPSPETSRPGAWTGAVEVTWRFAGFAAADSRVEAGLGFVREGDRVALTGFDDGAGAGPDGGLPGLTEESRSTVRTPTWLAGRLSVRRTPEVLVLAADEAGGDSRVDAYAAAARAAVPVVSADVGDWDRRLVVEVPADSTGLGAALGLPGSDVSAIAALTATPDGEVTDDAPVHVYVNPEVYDPLGRRGAQLVMTHETVHVATRAPGSPAPTWLIEGFADVVALRDADVGERVGAAQVAARVRRTGPPDALPSAADFNTSRTHIGATYESAWLACLVLAEAAGDAGLRRVYERADDGDDVAAAVRQEAGIDLATLTRRWQDRLETLAAGPGPGSGGRR